MWFSLTCSLYSQNIQHGPPLGKCLEVPWILYIYIYIFVISPSEQICKWDIKYVQSGTTDHVYHHTCAPPPLSTYQVWQKSVIAFSLEKRRFTFDVDEAYIHLYIHTYRHHYKWKLSSPSSITGGPQKVS